MIDAIPSVGPADETQRLRAGAAVSWGAILAGAVVAIGTSIILIALGSGIGLSTISTWFDRGESAASVTVMSEIWLIVTQWLSAAMGGYMAGRLRRRWLATHPHEVFFRDTAHGLVTWSVATVLMGVFAGSGIATIAGGGTHSALMAGGKTAGLAEAGVMDGIAYSADKLLRSAPTSMVAEQHQESQLEAVRIGANAESSGDMSGEDRAYLVALVAAKAGIPASEAQTRVDEFAAQVQRTRARAQNAAEIARKAFAETAVFTALALLIGAFIASVAAAIGGRLRDEHL